MKSVLTHQSISRRLQVGVGLAAGLVLSLTVWFNYRTGRAELDGQAAWDLFASSPFDIVLTDWEMPRLSGVELIERIRSTRDAGFVYILMLTSRSDKSDVVRGIEAGADDFVAKPFDSDELRVRLLAGEQYGQDRLESFLASLRDQPLDVVVKRVPEVLAEWGRTTVFADDVSLVAIEWPGHQS